MKQVRSGPKLTRMDTPTLEKLLSDMNNCELYARAHQQTSALDSWFILDIGERCPFYFRNRYTEFLLDHYDNPDQPTFESFKLFLSRELRRINATFAQRLLGLTANEKLERSRPPTKMRVHKISADPKVECSTSNLANKIQKVTREPPPTTTAPPKSLSVSFICSSEHEEVRHLLFNCGSFQNWSRQRRKDALMKVGRCFNCYQRHHVKDCKLPCKCRHCGATHIQKHATSLHDLYTVRSVAGQNFGSPENFMVPARGNLGATASQGPPESSGQAG